MSRNTTKNQNESVPQKLRHAFCIKSKLCKSKFWELYADTEKCYNWDEEQGGELVEGHTQITAHIHRLVIPYKHIFTTVFLLRDGNSTVLFDAASFDTDIDNYVTAIRKAMDEGRMPRN